MPKTVYFDGVPMQFADDVTDDEIVQFGDQQKQQSGVMSKVLSPMANMLRQATAYTAPVDVSTTPQIKGANYAFAGQQAVQNALAASQQSQQDRVSSQIQLRAMQAKEMEAEKDRAQQIKMQQTQFKNEAAIRQLEADKAFEAAKWSAEADANAPIETSWGMWDPKTKQIIPGSEPPAKPVRPVPMSPGSILKDPITGETIASVPAEPRQPNIRTEVVEVDGKKIAYTWKDGELAGTEELGAAPPRSPVRNPDGFSVSELATIDRMAEADAQAEAKALGMIDPATGEPFPEHFNAYQELAMEKTDLRKAAARAERNPGASAPPAAVAPTAPAPSSKAAEIANHLRGLTNLGPGEFRGKDTYVYRDNGDGTATRIR